MGTKWSERELYLLECLRPVSKAKEIKKIFSLLGYKRSLKSISRQAENQGFPYEGDGIPGGEFTDEEMTAIESTIGAEVDYEKKITSYFAPSPEKYEKDFVDALWKHYGATETEYTEWKEEVSHDGETVVLCLSDVHYGSKAVDEHGNVVFSAKIIEDMINSIPSKLMNSIPSRDYKEIVVILAGDILDGEEIYPSHQRHLDLSVIDQTKGLTKALWKMLRALEEMFPSVRVVCVRGNHGRMSKSADERSNWDNVIYHQLRIMAELSEYSDIVVEVSHGEFYNFEICGWKGHVRHIGVPHDGTAAMRQKIGSWYQMYNFDFFVCGHHHHAGILGYNGIHVFRNGAMQIGSDFAERIARNDPPRQIVFGVTRDKLYTFQTYLEWNVK